jgi:hypothetical protein
MKIVIYFPSRLKKALNKTVLEAERHFQLQNFCSGFLQIFIYFILSVFTAMDKWLKESLGECLEFEVPDEMIE